MKVQELIEYLSDLSPEAEVRIAYQPSWPMWESVTAAQAGTEDGAPVYMEGTCSLCSTRLDDHNDSECDGRDVGADIITANAAPAVYLIGGGENHYGKRALWDDPWS